MTFEEAIEYIDRAGNEVLTMNLGLGTIRALSDLLGRPEDSWPAVHIAGTNGKGSTSAMVEAILRVAGHRTGIYTSPHLVSVTERMRVAGEEISREEFARIAGIVREAGERLVGGEGGVIASPPTSFEQVTAIAMRWFAEQQVGIGVLEVGMGGRLDATNICHPVVTAITPVGLDHQQYLGDTVAAIAGEKAGIIKPGIPVVVALQESAARKVILERAAQLGATVCDTGDLTEAIVDLGPAPEMRRRYQFSTARRRLVATLSLRGAHQSINALTAISIIDCLIEAGWQVPESAIITGLESTEWPGRLELLPGDPPIFLDGAHNPGGAAVLRDFLATTAAGRSITLIFGAMRDKNVDEMAEILFPLADKLILSGIDSPRAFDPSILAESWTQAVCAADVHEALAVARHLSPANGLIVVCGSLYLIRELKSAA